MTNSPDPMQGFYDGVTNVSDFIWGGTWHGEQVLLFPPMVVVLLGVGIWIMIGLRFYPITHLGQAFAGLFARSKDKEKGEISPFAALSTALSGQVGTGNLAGVATAVTLGGPGALFWMWVTALIGMSLAFAEGSLAIRFREKGPDGHFRGGPMNYIRNGLGKKWGWLAVIFCIGLLFSSIATGNMIQANSFADSFSGLTGVPEWVSGIIVAVAVFAVIIGGIKSIGAIAEKIVPVMALVYLVMAVIALAMNFSAIPGAFLTIFESAFTGDQNLRDTQDRRVDFTNALSVDVNDKIALKPSLQFLWRNRPSLTDVPLFAPDGTATGTKVKTPLQKLDTFFRLALVVTL